MDDRSKERLQTITLKEPHELNDNDIRFLKARRDYLSTEQTEKYEEVLEAEVVVEKVDKRAEAKAEKESYKQLQKRASELGLEKVVGVSKEDLIGFISTTEGPTDQN